MQRAKAARRIVMPFDMETGVTSGNIVLNMSSGPHGKGRFGVWDPISDL